MTAPSVKEQIINTLDKLSPEQQVQVLDFTRRLQQSDLPPGIPGNVLVQRARAINFPKEDLNEIARAVEEESQKVDWDEW